MISDLLAVHDIRKKCGVLLISSEKINVIVITMLKLIDIGHNCGGDDDMPTGR